MAEKSKTVTKGRNRPIAPFDLEAKSGKLASLLQVLMREIIERASNCFTDFDCQIQHYDDDRGLDQHTAGQRKCFVIQR